MSKILFMEGLPITATEDEVVELLSVIGKVVEVKNCSTESEKCSRFQVEMESDEQAEAAIAVYSAEEIIVKRAS